MKLFGSSSDSESDYEEMFKSKPHFEGKKGEQVSLRWSECIWYLVSHLSQQCYYYI